MKLFGTYFNGDFAYVFVSIGCQSFLAGEDTLAVKELDQDVLFGFVRFSRILDHFGSD
jgi:hypothetical protein